MKLKIQEVGEGGTFILPLPRSILKLLGWKDGDTVLVDVPVTGRGTLVMEKSNG